jgi:DNA-binding MarR family transcriptional regulator
MPGALDFLDKWYYDNFIMKLLESESINRIPPGMCAGLLVDTVPLVMRTIRREMRQRREPGLTVPQMRTLAYVDGMPGATLSEVAEHVGLSLPSMSKIIDALVERGLVARQLAVADRRCVALTLTDQGRGMLEAARRGTAAKLAERLDRLSPTELAAITEVMQLLHSTFAPARDGE